MARRSVSPCHFQRIAHRGACGKTRVVVQNRPPKSQPAEMGGATLLSTYGGHGDVEQYVLGLEEINEKQAAVVGGKGAHLGALWRIEGVRVPAGFCVTTDAFRRVMAQAPS